ncbi:hypothetical protein IWZ00DRAFT_545860 [Phyllosticta capitalensis]
MQELPQANQGSRLYAKAIIEWHPNGEFAPSYLGDVHQAVIAIHSGLIAQRHVHITLSTQVTLSKPGVNGQDVTMFLLLTHKDIASAKMTHYVNPAGFNGGDCLEEGRIWNPWTRLGHYKNVPGPVFCGFYKRTPAYLGGLAGLSLRLAKPPVLVQPNVEMLQPLPGLNERKGEGDSISAPTQIENSKEVPPTSSKAPAVSNGNLAEKQAGQATHVEASAAHDLHSGSIPSDDTIMMEEPKETTQLNRIESKAVIEWCPDPKNDPLRFQYLHKVFVTIIWSKASNCLVIYVRVPVDFDDGESKHQQVDFFMITTNRYIDCGTQGIMTFDSANSDRLNLLNLTGATKTVSTNDNKNANLYFASCEKVPRFRALYDETSALGKDLIRLDLRLTTPPVICPDTYDSRAIPRGSGTTRLKMLHSMERSKRLRLFYIGQRDGMSHDLQDMLDDRANRTRKSNTTSGASSSRVETGTQRKDIEGHEFYDSDSGLKPISFYGARSQAYWLQAGNRNDAAPHSTTSHEDTKTQPNQRPVDFDSLYDLTDDDSPEEVPSRNSQLKKVASGASGNLEAAKPRVKESARFDTLNDSSSVDSEGPKRKRQRMETSGSLPTSTEASGSSSSSSSSSSNTAASAKETPATSTPPDNTDMELVRSRAIAHRAAEEAQERYGRSGNPSMEARVKRLEEALARQRDATAPAASDPTAQPESRPPIEVRVKRLEEALARQSDAAALASESMEAQMTRLEEKLEHRLTELERGLNRVVQIMDCFVEERIRLRRGHN